MGAQGPSSQHTLDAALEVFAQADPPGTPLTASEVADELDCARRTAYSKLETLADNGELKTKKVGARGRVWWRPVEPAPAIEARSGSGLDQAQFYELVETVVDYAIFVLDREGHIQTWNEGAKQIKGYQEDEIIGEHFSIFYTKEDRDDGRPETNLQAAQESDRIEDEGWRVREDGSTFWANVTLTALRDDDGELRGFMKVTRDMTERHEYEVQLREEKDRFETLVREVRDYAIFMLDADGSVQTWNEGAKQLKGYQEDEIIGEHFSIFYTEEDRDDGRPEKNLRKAVQEGRIEDEGRRVRKNGDPFWANVIITALYDDAGGLRGYAKVTRDVTERHAYEERLREQRDELDELNQINTVIRDIDQALVTATTRTEIEQAVCDRLAASDTYIAAWTAEYTNDYEEITPRQWAGISDDYLDSIRAADAEETREMERGVGAAALQTQTVQPVQQLQSDLDGEPWREASLAEGFASAVTVPLAYNEVEYGILTVYADRESAFDQRKIAVLGELGETISHAIAAVRRKEREQTLTALQGSTRELLHAETEEEIGDIIVGTLTGELALADAVVYYFDTTENALEPVSTSFQAETYTAQLAPLTAGADSPVWTSFMEDETQLTDSVLPARGMGKRRTMVVPLGDYGVLAVASGDQETFDRNTWNLVELIAATAEAAFDRLDSQANLRERDELLQEQNQRLQRLNQINTIIREVDQGLVQATTREGIEQVVCERLTTSDRFRFAWVGVPDNVEERLAPTAWNGTDRGYLDSIDLTPKGGKREDEPAVTALQTGGVTVISNVAKSLRGGQWRKEAFTREFQSVISVPLSHGDVTYGVLSVYADRPDVFDEMEQSVFAELGDTIANAINAVDTRHALLNEKTVELEFRLQDESASILARLARQVGCEVTFKGAIPVADDRARLFFVVRGASPDDIGDLLERSVAVESHQVLATHDDGHLVEGLVSGPSLVLSLLDYGASVRSFSVNDDGIHLVVNVPMSTDIRGFIQRFQGKYEGAEFIARRKRDSSLQTRRGLYAQLEESLTDRQLEVLKTAYYSGFFASPRESTGGDIADVLSVSQPTVTKHLRTAQRKVLDLLLEDRHLSA